MATKAKKNAPLPRKPYTRRQAVPSTTNTHNVKPAIELTPEGIQMFKLERGIPIPEGHSRVNKYRERVMPLVMSMDVGSSFTVPRSVLNTVKKINIEKELGYRFRYTTLSPDKKFIRIHRVS